MDNKDDGSTIWDNPDQSTSLFDPYYNDPKKLDLGPALGDSHLTSEQFVAALPQSRQSFKVKYLDYENTEEFVGY